MRGRQVPTLARVVVAVDAQEPAALQHHHIALRRAGRGRRGELEVSHARFIAGSQILRPRGKLDAGLRIGQDIEVDMPELADHLLTARLGLTAAELHVKRLRVGVVVEGDARPLVEEEAQVPGVGDDPDVQPAVFAGMGGQRPGRPGAAVEQAQRPRDGIVLVAVAPDLPGALREADVGETPARHAASRRAHAPGVVQSAIDHTKAIDGAPKGRSQKVMLVAVRAGGPGAKQLARQLAALPTREIAVGPVLGNSEQGCVRVNQAFAGIVEFQLLDAPRGRRRAAALHVVYGAEIHVMMHCFISLLTGLGFTTGMSV